jgi:serine/threonine protein kinase
MMFEKGTVGPMTLALFCDECGAELPAQATSCAVCRQYFGASVPPPQIAAVQTPLPLPLSTPAGVLYPGSMLAQRYWIISQVGQGGFGAVYKAKDCSEKNKLVAIKQISLKGLSPQKMIEATDTYNREIMCLSQLKHENLPRVYDHFTDPHHWYVVMEYIEGKTLEDMLKTARGGRFSVKKVVEIGITMSSVLSYLHAQYPPIIYRDVKPANILFTREGRLSLIDFGIARQYRPGQAKDTGPLGSPGYAAPEQYGRAQTTAQSDIYSLGATLQTLLTGKEPLETLVGGESPDSIKPKELRALLAQMLESDASKRPQSVDEVKQSLLRLKEHSAGQRVKRTLTVTWEFITHAGLQVIPLVALLLFIFIIFLLNGFFNSPFWILSLLLMLCTIFGRSAHYLHQEIEEIGIKLNAKEAFGVVMKRLKGSILFALIPAVLLFYLYYIPQDSPTGGQPASGVLTSGDQPVSSILLWTAMLAFITCGIIFLKGEISWLLRPVTWWRRPSTPEEVPPLQQRVRKLP